MARPGMRSWNVLNGLSSIWSCVKNVSKRQKGPTRGERHRVHAHDHLHLGRRVEGPTTKIPVEEIIDIWREESKGGRYLNKLLWGGQALPQMLQEMEFSHGDRCGGSERGHSEPSRNAFQA